MAASLNDLQRELRALGDADTARHAQRFFKTGRGEYGEGDEFLGIRMPVIRNLARAHAALSEELIVGLLNSEYHEERMLALLILVNRYSRGSDRERSGVYRLFMDNIDQVNNWDLVDASAPRIVGGHLEGRSRKPLYRLARSRSLWRRRIAVMATLWFIRNHDFEDTLAIALLLLNDEQDLIHKAVGWMLREVGNRDRAAEEAFLIAHQRSMPRTMLRYAIEKLPEHRRKAYLQGTAKRPG